MVKKKEKGACYFRMLPELKAAAKERAESKDLTLAQHLRGLVRADLDGVDELAAVRRQLKEAMAIIGRYSRLAPGTPDGAS